MRINLFQSRESQVELIDSVVTQSQQRVRLVHAEETLKSLQKYSEHDRFLEKFDSIYLRNLVAQSFLKAKLGRDFKIPLNKKVNFEQILFTEGRDSVQGVIDTCSIVKGLQENQVFNHISETILSPLIDLISVYYKMLCQDGSLPIGPSKLGGIKPNDFPVSISTPSLTFIHDPIKNLFIYISHPEFDETQFGHVGIWHMGHWILYHPFHLLNLEVDYNSIKKSFLQSKSKSLNVHKGKNDVLMKTPWGTRRVLILPGSIQILDVGGWSRFHINPESEFELTGESKTKQVNIPSLFLPIHRIDLKGSIRSVTFRV